MLLTKEQANALAKRTRALALRSSEETDTRLAIFITKGDLAEDVAVTGDDAISRRKSLVEILKGQKDAMRKSGEQS